MPLIPASSPSATPMSATSSTPAHRILLPAPRSSSASPASTPARLRRRPRGLRPDIHNGDTATLTLDEYPGQQFTGTIARNSNAIDQSSRTLNVEVDVDNPAGKLLPGAYVFVTSRCRSSQLMLAIPSNTLLFRAQGLQVAIARDGHVHLQNVVIGKDDGKTVEIATGLSASDAIIVDPSDSIAEGEPVKATTLSAVPQ
jgi:RND family efflux transporter MFP subunit